MCELGWEEGVVMSIMGVGGGVVRGVHEFSLWYFFAV